MSRMEEYEALMAECDREVPGLETTLDRAYAKKRKRTTQRILRPLGGLAACFAVFVLLVNFCAPVAYACSKVPGLRELAEAVTFSRSLSDAVDNEYVQPMDLSQSANGVTAEIAYLIVDQKQVNVFFRLDSDIYDQLEADPDVLLPCGLLNNSFGAENGQLRSVTIDFVDEDVPESLVLQLKVYAAGAAVETAPVPADAERFPDIEEDYEREYLAEFEFLLEFDPLFTAAGRIYPVNQVIDLDGQKVTITEIEVYPTHLRVDIGEDEANTAWIRDLDFYIETDWGMRFDTGSGITATGSTDSPSMISYRCDSPYFYEAAHLKLVITGAKFLDKDRERIYLDLRTGQSDPLPEGVAFHEAYREGEDWVLSFRADWDEESPMQQLFRYLYYDAGGNEYEVHMWSSTYGDPDENGEIRYYIESFPLKDYPYDEVWLTPQFTRYWTAENQIVITVE